MHTHPYDVDLGTFDTRGVHQQRLPWPLPSLACVSHRVGRSSRRGPAGEHALLACCLTAQNAQIIVVWSIQRRLLNIGHCMYHFAFISQGTLYYVVANCMLWYRALYCSRECKQTKYVYACMDACMDGWMDVCVCMYMYAYVYVNVR